MTAEEAKAQALTQAKLPFTEPNSIGKTAMVFNDAQEVAQAYLDAIAVLEEALEFTKSHVIGTESWYAERDDVRAKIEDFLAGKVTE